MRTLNPPAMRGLIARRLLVNFRVDPDAIGLVLPEPFHPQLLKGSAIAGVCLIRLEELRPSGTPSAIGLASENAAHRIAVQWGDGNDLRTGVYILRRDTTSLVSTVVGGRLFPGVHHRARFEVEDDGDRCRIDATSQDGTLDLVVEGHRSISLSPSSAFNSLDEASGFFERGSIGYSPALEEGRLDGIELICGGWRVEPFDITTARSSFFENQRMFPRGSVEFDCALIMRNVKSVWTSDSMDVATS